MTTNDADHVSEANAYLIAHAAYIARRITGLEPEVEEGRKQPNDDVLPASVGLWQPLPATWEEA